MPLACAAPPRQTSGPITVVATTTQIQDFVLNVASDRIRLIGILQGDDDPHEYELSPGDVGAIAHAEVIFANGLGLEPWFGVLARNARSGAILTVFGDAPGVNVMTGDEDEPEGDPHVWFDPTNAQAMVLAIRDTLSAANPGNAALYAANAQAYIDQIAH